MRMLGATQGRGIACEILGKHTQREPSNDAGGAVSGAADDTAGGVPEAWHGGHRRRWRTAPLTLSVHMTPSVRTRPSIRPDVSPHIRYGGYSRPSMTQPPPTPSFPHQQAKRARQNQHVASFNPRKAAPRGGLPRVTSRRSAHEPDMGRHLAGCSTGSVDFRTRWTSSALIVSS